MLYSRQFDVREAPKYVNIEFWRIFLLSSFYKFRALFSLLIVPIQKRDKDSKREIRRKTQNCTCQVFYVLLRC